MENYYVLNLQGDVIELRNADGTLYCSYTYDAWGKVLSVRDGDGNAITGINNIANRNPLRYRGYVYDPETKLYYCQSRYYDPQTRRFINADSLVSTGSGFNGFNMYAYCNNNPVMYVDYDGTSAKKAVFTCLDTVANIGLEVLGNNAPSNKSSISMPRLAPDKPSPRLDPIPEPKPTYEEKVYAATVYAEAGGQNYKTKQAVAHVMNNRVGTKETWNSVTDVVSCGEFDGYGNIQYESAMNYYNTGMCSNPLEQIAMEECMTVIVPIYFGSAYDFTEGALFFHSLDNPTDWKYHDAFTQIYVDGTEKFWFYK